MVTPVRPRRTPATPLRAVASAAGAALPDVDAEPAVTGVTHDSRQVRPGDLYAALPGAHDHGAAFAGEAADRGAVALLTDALGAGIAAGTQLPTVVATDPRGSLGEVASLVYGGPSRRLSLYGVTGTNGKTTTAYLLDAGLRGAGLVTGVIGTIETRVAGEQLPSKRTTPEATDLQALLAVMVERGVQAVAMEVSSHALALGRVGGCHFTAGLFTNLSQDHLDFHGTMEDYYAAKRSLFDAGRCDGAVVNVDDPWGERLAGDLAARAGGTPTVTVGERGTWSPAATPGGFRVSHTGRGVDVAAHLRLLGSFNVANAALALVTLLEAGVDGAAAAAGIGGLAGVPGRMERVDGAGDPLALVDYAHTPEAVVTLLGALRPLTAGRLILVLGCGGDRDRAKRPLMGAAAARLADVAVFTDDNPRSEPSAAILTAMREGARAAGGARAEVVTEPDRAAAIALAVTLARPGDTVAVAGKGHETGQDVGGTVLPFDDRVVLRDALASRRERLAGARP